MKALWFMPFAFAGGAEGFALFAPYLIGVLSLLYVARTLRAAHREMPKFRLMPARGLDVLPVAQPAL
jgi:hypothetical protein